MTKTYCRSKKSLSTLPNEIFSQILELLCFDDQKNCMVVSHAWCQQFKPLVLQFIHVVSNRQLRQLFEKLKETEHTGKPFGYLIRRLTLGPQVGITAAHFIDLPILCPFLEFFDFNSSLWRYLTYNSTFMLWKYLKKLPCMQLSKLTVPILRDTGKNLTQLEMSSIMVDQLASSSFTVISILSYTPNLISLKLSDGIMSSQNMSVSEFESIHASCQQLETLHLSSFDAHLLSNDSYLIDIETLDTAVQLKELRLRISINNEEFLNYWARKYPYIKVLDLNIRLLEPEYYHEAVQPENSRMKESFYIMATKFTQLKSVTAEFDEKYFPCDIFLRGLNDASVKMEHISIHFFNFDYHRRTARNLKHLISNSANTIQNIDINNWDRSWCFLSDILEPMSNCNRLRSLSLSPQPGTLTEFDIDIILDCCIHLKKLELANTYNLFVRDDARSVTNITTRLHQLEEFSLKHTMVDNRLFEYLAIRCPHLHTLKVQHVTKPYDNNIQVKIDMPNHSFKLICIGELKLGLRLEDVGFQCNRYSTIFSIEQVEKTLATQARRDRHKCSFPQEKHNHKYHKRNQKTCSERWYHLYQPFINTLVTDRQHNHTRKKASYVESSGICSKLTKMIMPRLQRLKDTEIDLIKKTQVTKQLCEQISYAGARIKYENRKNWDLDIKYGYTSVRCKSVKKIMFEGIQL